MTSLSYSFDEQQINTKYEAYRLIYDPTRLITLLYSKYGDIEEDLYFLYINQLIYNLPTKFNCIFKEIKYTNLTHDYLKRIYKTKESINRIPKLSDYYKNYHIFFCRPTLRNYKLSKIMCNYQDKKAEIFYKNNYKETKENISTEKDENNNKKNSSFSLSSFDNITNNKIIFDKQTKKILDKSETELKNNNYYNTLILETSRSNILLNNGLISKRTGGNNSFEKCIHALVEYQFNKKKFKERKKNRKTYIKNKKLKNMFINTNYSNIYYKIKNNISQSQRETHKFYNHNKILNNKTTKNNSNSKTNSNYINKIIKNKNKKKSLYSLSNNRYNISTNTLIYNNNKCKINDIKEYNINYPITTTNKDSKKIKNHVHVHSNNNTINNIGNNIKNNSNTMPNILSNSNSNTNSNMFTMKSQDNNTNNLTKFSKLSEYLNQIKGKDNKFIQKNALHKKNCLSIGEDEKNILFNLNNKNRVTKKKIHINKNLKITITNGNINSTKKKSRHIKNKTLDYNSTNQTNNNLAKKKNNIITNEDYNTLLKKNSKSILNKIDNKNSKNIFTKINKINNNKKTLFSPSSKKISNKISVTQNSSKEKSYKKNLNAKIFNFNNKKKKEYECRQKVNSPKHIKNNKSSFAIDNPNNVLEIKSNKTNKTNFSLSMNRPLNNNINMNIKNIISKNAGTLCSPTNQLFNSIVYFKRNANQISNSTNFNNNIYIKKSIKNDNIIINKKKTDKDCNSNNNTKEIYSNIFLPIYTNNNKNNNNPNNDNNNNNIDKNLSRNKKKISNNNLNISKKSKIHTKTNSNLKNNPLNCNIMINDNININDNDLKKNINKNNRNINISIEKNNINIKDSILHIDKIYIKKENSNKKQKIYEIEMPSHNENPLEIKVKDEVIKTFENDKNINNEKKKSIDYSTFKMNHSPKVINVHRNFNLLTKNIK